MITASSGNWASCVRIVEPISRKTLHLYELENNEHALSMCILNFENKDETYICVGSIKDYQVHPNRNNSVCYITTFLLNEKTNQLELVHKTEIFEIPGALHAHKGKLLVKLINFLTWLLINILFIYFRLVVELSWDIMNSVRRNYFWKQK